MFNHYHLSLNVMFNDKLKYVNYSFIIDKNTSQKMT